MTGESPEPAAAQPEPPQPQSLIDRFGGLLMEALPAIAGAIGFVGFIAVVGGAIQWFRFFAAELPADQAVHVIPRTELVTIGAISTAGFTLLGVLALLLVYLLDRSGDASPGTRRGLLIIAGAELASVGLIIDLQVEEYVLLVLWAILVAGLAYKPVERAARALQPRFARLRDEQEYSEEKARFELATAEHEDASNAHQAAVASDLPAEEREPYARALRTAKVTLETARLRWARVSATHAPHEHEGTSERVSRWWSALKDLEVRDLVALGLFLLGVGVILGYEHTKWLIWVMPVPVLLFFALLGIARATSRFAWYGISVFLSVVLFGGVLAVADTLQTPRVQPVALVRKSDDHAICGVYITQSDKRLYVGRVDNDGQRLAKPYTGRIFWIPVSDIDVVSIGPLQPLATTEKRAMALLDEVYVDRAEEAPTKVKNAVTVVEKVTTVPDLGTKAEGDEKVTETTTTTTEKPADSGRPTRREPPSGSRPKSCAPPSRG